ncbi:hypothetical protein BC833DRAFT_195326 [Globomyces pollinis-pini]|nr:hypothetical protein BC833DRAFT_195326 [Globomyces pollinis-pini]
MNLIISCFLLGLATAAPPAYLEKDVKGPYVELITNNNLRINTGGKQSCYNINPSNIAKLNFITSEYGILYYSNIDCESHSRLLDGSAPQAVDGPVPAEIAKTLVKSVRLVSVAAKVNGSPNISSDGDSYFIQSYIPEYKQSADSNVPANVASYVNDQANVAAYQSPTDLKVQLMVGNNEKLSKGYGILFYSALNCAHHSRMLDGSKPQSWTGKVQYEFAFNDIASFR